MDLYAEILVSNRCVFFFGLALRSWLSYYVSYERKTITKRKLTNELGHI